MRANKAVRTKQDHHGQGSSKDHERQLRNTYKKTDPILNKIFEKHIKKQNRIAIVEFLVYNKKDAGCKIAVETLYQWEQRAGRKA